jgi:hypothetical protein
MEELTIERQKTIGRNLREVARYIDKAKAGLDRQKKEQRAVWEVLDLAEGRLRSLSAYLSLFSDDDKEAQ